jgi:hypothetical protein
VGDAVLTVELLAPAGSLVTPHWVEVGYARLYRVERGRWLFS